MLERREALDVLQLLTDMGPKTRVVPTAADLQGQDTREQAWFWEPKATLAVHAEARRLLTQDVNAAAAAALAAGVDQLVMCDTHHGGNNVLWDEVLADQRVTYELPQAARVMPTLDETFDGLILLGHHAKAGTGGAFLEHTWSGNWFDVRINGLSVGEVGLEACYAGHWDVPLIMVQGDEACCAEAEAQFLGVITAPVKRALGFDRATGPAPELARTLTAQRVQQAVRLARERAFVPFKPQLRMTVQVVMNRTDDADKAALRRGVRRLDGRTVEAELERRCDVIAWIVG
ncbi:MAG: M55 family metallopeptidase [Chloroflexi bacterium]|nr:M55 family metallopeptidase [Chloroflexota bacterium]